MVTSPKYFLAALTSAALVLSACTSSDTNPSTETPAVSVNDLSNAKPVQNFSLKVDTLSLHYKQGDKLKYRATQMTESRNDSVIVTANAMFEYMKTIKKVRSDSAYEIGMTITRVKISQKAVNAVTNAVLEEQSYDSQDSASSKKPQFNNNQALLNEEVTMIMDKRGGIREILGTTSIANKIVKGRTDVPPDAVQQLTRMLESSVYIAYTKEEILNFPDSVRADGSWSLSAQAPYGQIFMISQKGDFKVSSIKEVNGHKLATIASTTSGSIAPMPLDKSIPIKVDIKEFSTGGTGEITLDAETGITIKRTNDLTMNAVAEITNTKQNLKQTMRQSTITRVKIELIP